MQAPHAGGILSLAGMNAAICIMAAEQISGALKYLR